MPVFYIVFFVFAVTFAAISPTASIAQGDYEDEETTPPLPLPGFPTSHIDPNDIDIPEDTPPGVHDPGEPMTNDSIVDALTAATKYCELLLPEEYIVDCLSERLGAISKQLEGQKEFAEVQAILELTARKLNDVARENRSTTLAPAHFSTPGKKPGTARIATSRRLIPVDPAKADKAIAEAIVVIEEAQTILLRSAEDSTNRSIQFQRISAALGSNKVLLRSL